MLCLRLWERYNPSINNINIFEIAIYVEIPQIIIIEIIIIWGIIITRGDFSAGLY